jgi:hydrogenase nickel incorporation protein HypB
MCATCGCGDDADVRVNGVHEHEHGHGHGHGHMVDLEQKVLARNDDLARANREWLAANGIHAVNVMSSPGAGKTTLLVRTIRDLGGRLPVSVVEGDQETSLDADRVRATGVAVVQVNTGVGCHLDASMVARALQTLGPPADSVLIVENVGNLVCPALFDLGEAHRVVIMSVTDGADKPRKYPHMFAAADVVVLNKVDLLPYVDFDRSDFTSHLTAVNPRADVLPVSATRGDGLSRWYDWLCASAPPSTPHTAPHSATIGR